MGITPESSNIYGVAYKDLILKFERLQEEILKQHPHEVSKIEVKYSCDFLREKATKGTELKSFIDHKLSPKTPVGRLNPRGSIRGGQVNAFYTMAEKSEENNLRFVDIRLILHEKMGFWIFFLTRSWESASQ